MTRGFLMLEWLIRICKALISGKFNGSIQIRFKDGGISSITKPKEKGKTWTDIKEMINKYDS